MKLNENRTLLLSSSKRFYSHSRLIRKRFILVNAIRHRRD